VIGAATRPTPWLVGTAAAAAAGLLVVYADGVDLALGLVLTVAAVGVTRLVTAGRQRREAAQVEDQVVELCEALAAELRAGQPPVVALESSVASWHDFGVVAAAARLGADVPAAVRRLAGRPGASGLHALAAAWQVSQHSGAGLADAVERVADSVREARSVQRLVTSELASAQATARTVALLPLGVLTMGSGLGGDPWSFLLRSPIGVGCLGLGLALAYLGLAWIDRVAGAVGS